MPEAFVPLLSCREGRQAVDAYISLLVDMMGEPRVLKPDLKEALLAGVAALLEDQGLTSRV